MEPNTAIPAAPSNDVTAAELATAISALAAKVESMSASQTADAALRQQEGELRQRAAENPENVGRLTAEMLVLEARHKAEIEKLRTTIDARKSSYSMGEAVERIGEIGAVCREDTRAFWAGIGSKAQSSDEWQTFAEGMTPTEVLLRGAFEPRTIDTPYGDGRTFSVVGVGAMTAGSNDPVLAEAQRQYDAMHVWRMRRDLHRQSVAIQECPWYPRYERAMSALAHALPLSAVERSMTATTLANLVPTGFSARLIERFELSRNLLRYIPFYQMNQNPEGIGRRGTYLTPRKHVSSSSDSENISTKIATTGMVPTKLTLNLHQFVFRVPFDIESEEDVFPAFLPMLIDDLGRSWAYWLERAICDSSDAVIPVPGHIDVDVTSTTSALNAWQGLRPAALANSYTRSLATFNDDTVIAGMHQDMGKYSGSPMELICITGAKTKAKLKLLKTSGGHPLMMGNASPQMAPSAQTGTPMLELDGSPLVVVESWRENVNASGFYDGTTTSQGTLLWLNTRGILLAAKNLQGRTYTEFNTQTAQTEILSHNRVEVEDNYDFATERFLNLGVGISF